MLKPLVSVVIPTYNREGFLKEAIDSVAAQTRSDWELVVVDDGSTDGTRGLVASYACPRIRYLAQMNLGVAAARNRGAKESRGHLLAFLDSDDLWLPRKLEVQLEFFERQPEISICQTEEIWVRRGRRVNAAAKHLKRSGWIFEACLPLCIVSPSAVMMRREAFDALGGFDERFRACEDYDLWLRAALRYEIATLEEPLIVKRGGHPDQLSGQWGLDRWRVEALEKLLADPSLDRDRRPLVLREIVRRSEVVAVGARKRGNIDLCDEFEARGAAARAALVCPSPQ